MQPLYDALIIGAGIAGLTLASRLRAQNRSFLILEKSPGVGGRIATRRGEDCAYDHGAQFIRIKASEDTTWPDLPKIQEVGKVWFSADARDHIVFPKGMTQFPKSLVVPEELKLGEKVITITVHDETCVLQTEHGQTYRAKQLYMTCPVPQSLSLLRDSGIPYPSGLEEIHYASTLVGLFRVQSAAPEILNLHHLQDVSDQIYSVSNQLSKQVSQNLAFTVVMQPEWSKQHFDQEDKVSLQEILVSFEKVLSQFAGPTAYTILNSQLKKWRYSHPLTSFESPHVSLHTSPRIILLGDGFGGASIQGAIRSAYSVPLTE